MATTATPRASTQQRLTPEEALKVARLDAEQRYRELSTYKLTIVLERDGWHVDYALKDPNLQGGGPHYVIDAISGKIVSKRYEQ